jgi:hypothetical protein
LQQVIFHDFTTVATKHHINVAKLEKICRAENLGYIVQINLIQNASDKDKQAPIHPSIESVLQDFDDIFSETTELPPQRDYDHEIPLLPSIKPQNVRPYRVPHKQMDEVHRLIQAMLQDSLIRPSKSPYSSPAILVRKKDDS